jgi:hypothetical protein
VGAALKKCGIDTTMRRINGTRARMAALPVRTDYY